MSTLDLSNLDRDRLRSLLKTLLLEIVRSDRKFAADLLAELTTTLETPNPRPEDESEQKPSIVGMFSGPPDLASRSEEILHSELSDSIERS